MPPKLSQHHASQVVKLLYIGDSGSGKTGSLASLANDGYQLRFLDYDNGLDVLHSYVDQDKKDNIIFETLTDKMKPVPAAPGRAPSFIPAGAATAWIRSAKLLNRWKTDEYDLGPVTSWGPEIVLVVDSLTLQGRAALNFVKDMNKASMEPDWGYYGPAMELQEKMLDMLYSDAIRCNVIVTSHIVHVARQKKTEVTGQDGKVRIQSVDVGDAKAYPSALGNKLPPKIGRYFNAALRAKTYGGKRIIQTVSDDEIELKNPAPISVPRHLDLGTGLAEYFRLVKKAAGGS